MRFFNHGQAGQEALGALDAAGVRRDLSAHAGPITPSWIASGAAAWLSGIDLAALPRVAEETRIAPVVLGAQKFICIGKNYADHASEMGGSAPSEPLIFHKALSSISGAYDSIEIPPGATQLDYEVELGVIIGRRAKYIAAADAPAHIFGYCLVNDVSERDYQMNRQGQYTKGKSHDSFGPIGPYLVTADEIPDPQSLRLQTWVDGAPRQDGSTADMIHKIYDVVAYLSQFMSLNPGDIIATGTPSGVAAGMKPEPGFLRAGQRVEMEITGLGRQAHLCLPYGAI